MMDVLIKTVVLGLVGAVLCLVVKKANPEIALLLALGVALVLTAYGLGIVESVTEFIRLIGSASGLSAAILSPVLKTVGIGILTRLASDICKDAGQAAIASSVELAGTASALYVALPLFRTVFEMIEGLLL